MALNVSGSYNGPLISDYVNHNFAQGDNNTFAADVTNSFAQGQNCSIGTENSFAQGYGLTIPNVNGNSNTIAGTSNTVAGTFAYQAAIFGRNHSTTNPYNSLVFGQNQSVVNGYGNITGGYNNTVTGTQYYSIIVANTSTFASVTSSVNVGISHTVSGTNLNNAAFGRAIGLTNNQNCLTAGYLNSFSDGVTNSLNVGTSNVVSGDNSFALGNGCNASDYNSIAMGHESDALSTNNFAFGSYCRAGSGDYPNNVAFGGYYTYADGYNSQAFGYYSQITPGSAYGTVLGGFATTIEANNCLAHGKTAGADITGQRAFSAQTDSGGSSSGTFPFGPANSQWSFVAHSQTFLTASPTTTISIPTDEDRAYSVQVNIVINEITAGTSANRGQSLQAGFLAYNNGGTVTLVGSPTLTDNFDGADISNFTTAIGTSSADITITYTRNAGTLNYNIGYWVAFMEIDT